MLTLAKNKRWVYHLHVFEKGTYSLKFRADILFVRAKLPSIVLWLLVYIGCKLGIG